MLTPTHAASEGPDRPGWRVLRAVVPCLIACLFSSHVSSLATAQSDKPAPSSAQNSQAASQPASRPAEEITTRDESTTFKVNVNLVLVRVVVRDSKGQAVGNLQKDDFQLFDNRKPQVISHFSAEQAGTKPVVVHEEGENQADENAPVPNTEAAGKANIADSYIAYLFDDVHLTFGDLAQARNAADRHMASLRPTDRAAIFTTSGQNTVDFTDDRARLHQDLLDLRPRPISPPTASDCFSISYYMADLIQNQHDPQALSAATQDALICQFNGDPKLQNAAQQLADATSQQVLDLGSHESQVSLSVVSAAIRRLSVAPGRRSIVLVSPGFLTPRLESQYTAAIDQAVKAQVVIGALDARGLYVVPAGGDISRARVPSPQSVALRAQYDVSEASADAEILGIFAEATGGVFFHNSNDLDDGFRRVASTPEYSYVLGFSPANLKLDGSFHSLKVRLKNQQKFSIQARRGYYAPNHAVNPAEQAKQEIEDAVFSQEEMHSLPVELHTQFFKSSDFDAKLTVLAHIDVRRLHLRKLNGRNHDELTVVSALFNGNGNLVQGIEKTITMQLKDETLERKMGSGITLRTSFDVKPGSYLVRLVVRDSEAQLLSAENGAVRIP